MAWLFDLCPPGYRDHDVLRKHPLILRMARRHVSAALAAARHGYGTARAEIGPTLPAAEVDAMLRVHEHEGSRAAATDRAVRLVAEALGGEQWEPRL
ncbi:hypothetical protein ACFZBU_38580 [Embleya sp. NPDC008237]|uniref:hypothetical protein n=1 Tax=Embleya sp. NPDC008237 TaxID=3363978 RepID=UPI0036E60E83